MVVDNARGQGKEHHEGRRNLVWVANIAFPYRIALYREIERSVPQAVILLGKSEPGRHWSNSGLPDFVGWAPAIQYSFGRYVFYSLLPIAGMRKIRQSRPAVIILPSWHYPASWRIALWATVQRIPMIAWYESTAATHGLRLQIVQKSRRLFFCWADLVISTGSRTTTTLLEMGIPADHIVTGYNSVDGRWFHRRTTEIRERASTRPSGHRYLYVGQLIPRKNPDLVLKGFAALHDQAASLAIAGLGPMERQLRALADELGISSQVAFLGHLDQDDLSHLYASSNTLVLASSEEVWGLVVNEALSCGLHTVVSRACSVSDDVKDHQGVFIVEPEVNAVAHGMQQSADSWKGPVQDPKILKMANEDLAKVCLSAVENIMTNASSFTTLTRARNLIRRYRSSPQDRLT